jgi:hypothetical protein
MLRSLCRGVQAAKVYLRNPRQTSVLASPRIRSSRNIDQTLSVSAKSQYRRDLRVAFCGFHCETGLIFGRRAVVETSMRYAFPAVCTGVVFYSITLI